MLPPSLFLEKRPAVRQLAGLRQQGGSRCARDVGSRLTQSVNLVHIYVSQLEVVDDCDREHSCDEVVIAKAGEPLVCLVPYQARHPTKRVPGSARGLFTMTDDFAAPLPAEEIEAWEQ